jgi:peptidoglycan hydrolase CwlO-like protein
MQRQITFRRGTLLLAALVTLAVLLVEAPGSFGDLNSRQRSLQQGINSDNGQIGAYEGRLHDLQARLSGLESSLAIQRAFLVRIQDNLASDRERLAELRVELKRDRRVLAAQLVAQYEASDPDLVDVVMESHGFNDLLERVDQLKLIAQRNADTVRRTTRDQQRVRVAISQLAQAEVRQRRVTAAVLTERDQVVSIRLVVLEHEHVALRDRARKQAQLRAVKHQLAVLQTRAAAAQQASFGSGGAATPGFVPDGGSYGFFPAPGTNYSVGVEPEIAARLDKLGKALHLHLIGLSGYRTPQHSVEVGGFPDDPHTRGEASDTPGVEGVPESTLLQFGLTRPFPGPAEADHIQLA